jgi:oxygen-independent coproporphyrinogen-3 oxidase
MREAAEKEEDDICTRLSFNNDSPELCASVFLQGRYAEKTEKLAPGTGDKEQERALAALLFSLLRVRTGLRPPWGILTGIRPVRFCNALMERGLDERAVMDALVNDYEVMPEKAALALETARAERAVLALNGDRAFSLYISIPFCPSRCHYCSFVSHEIEKCAKLIPDYVRLLCEEIRHIAETARGCGLTLQTVYIGGGTPTTLDAADLARIMAAVRDSFDLSGLLEYTVEAGRPDTITADKLRVIRDYGATRISINPQTMRDDVLNIIGRAHTARQVSESFLLAREAGFDVINMDVIAGLPGDTEAGYLDTIDQVLAFKPENITVHTLTLKRASALRDAGGALSPMDVAASLESGAAKLRGAGYTPYYMYRQKGTRDNLENIGYTRPGHAGVYNVYIMEEVHTVLAAGAGGVTKLCAPPSTVKRVYNYKYPYEYIARFDEMLRRKSEVENFYAGTD